MPPVAMPDVDEDIFDLDIEMVLESDTVAPIQACSAYPSTCGTQVSWSGTCLSQWCGHCTPSYGAMAPGNCV